MNLEDGELCRVAPAMLHMACVLTLTCTPQIANQRQCLMHPHIIQFREAFCTDEHIGVVMEYLAGSDMRCEAMFTCCGIRCRPSTIGRVRARDGVSKLCNGYDFGDDSAKELASISAFGLDNIARSAPL